MGVGVVDHVMARLGERLGERLGALDGGWERLVRRLRAYAGEWLRGALCAEAYSYGVVVILTSVCDMGHCRVAGTLQSR